MKVLVDKIIQPYGHDTVSSAIMYTLYCLSNHIYVQQKVLKEQMDIFGRDLERDPTYSDIQQMKFLDMVIKETLRLYPSAPIIERLMTEDVDIAGLNIPKDTTIFINIYEMHRNPDIYENPSVFKPERFDKVPNSHLTWIPFSAGPRSCIGQKFAIMEMKVALSSIVRQFELLPSGIAPIICWDVSMKSKNGIHVSMIPRSWSG